jgi:hypothetical protein
MKIASSVVKSLVLLGFTLPTLAQTSPLQTGKMAAPQPPAKATTAKSLSKKYEGPKVAESTKKLGQKFVDKSYEDTAPGRVLIPVKKVTPDQK